MAPNNDNHRIQSFDVLKGFIIIAIVFVHLFFLSYSEGEARSDAQPIFIQILYTGLMVFFIISGYFFRPARGFVNNTKKRVVMLGTAFVIANLLFTLILFAELNLTGQGASLDDVVHAYWNLIGGPGVFQSISSGGADANYGILSVACGHYFIELMIIAFIVFYAVADAVMKDTRTTIAAIVILVVIQSLYTDFVNYHLPFFAELAPIAAAFMLFGALLGKLKIVEKFETEGYKDKRFWIGILLAFAVGLVLAIVFPPDILFDMSVFGAYGGMSVFPYFVMCCCLCCFFIAIGWIFSHIPVLSTLLRAAGRHTLAILIIHCFFIKLVTAPFHTIPNSGYWFPEMGVMEIVAVGLVTVIVITLLAEYGPGMIKKFVGKKSD